MSRRRWMLVVGVGALVLGIAGAVYQRWNLLTAREPSPIVPTVPHAAAPRARPVPGVSAAEVLGINEGISIADMPLQRIGRRADMTLRRRAMMVADAGARSVRVTTQTWPNLSWHDVSGKPDHGWNGLDQVAEVAGAANLDLVVMVGPWPGVRTASYTSAYLPKDMEAYLAWVTTTVERYDGDGVDDMPGLVRPIRAWEVDNEPDLHHGSEGAAQNAAPGRGEKWKDDLVDDMATGFESAPEYARMLVETSRAVKAADPDATVLSGGFFRIPAPRGRAYAEAVFAQPGALAAIDVLSVHCYFTRDSLDAVDATLEAAHAVAPGKRVWITETSVPSDGREDWVDEGWQARMLAGIVGAALGEGADRVYWHTLADPPTAPVGRPFGFSTNSLLRSRSGASGEPGTPDAGTTQVVWEPKPAADVYRRLSRHLDGVNPASIAEVPAQGGRLLETDRGWFAFWGAPVLPDGPAAAEDLVTGAILPAAASVQAPAWIAR